jgi:hypothetical protein
MTTRLRHAITKARDQTNDGEVMVDNGVFWQARTMASKVTERGCDGDDGEVEELQRRHGDRV